MAAIRPLLLVWAALLALLALTVGASFALAGPASLATGIAAAAGKTALIYWVFMHLRRESGLVRLVACGVLAWVAILFVMTLLDTATRTEAPPGPFGPSSWEEPDGDV
jgi:cytochrome c oxidase subunit 4